MPAWSHFLWHSIRYPGRMKLTILVCQEGRPVLAPSMHLQVIRMKQIPAQKCETAGAPVIVEVRKMRALDSRHHWRGKQDVPRRPCQGGLATLACLVWCRVTRAPVPRSAPCLRRACLFGLKCDGRMKMEIRIPAVASRVGFRSRPLTPANWRPLLSASVSPPPGGCHDWALSRVGPVVPFRNCNSAHRRRGPQQ